MWGLDYKEGWEPKNWCFWTVMLDKTLESPLDCKEIQQINSKGNQSWIFIGRTDAEAEAPILWPRDMKNQLIGKDPDAGKDWRQEKGTTEEEMVGWHHWLNGHEFEQAPGDGEGQGSLACLSPWSHKELVMIEQLNNKPLLSIHSNGNKYICFAVWSYHYPSTELFSSCKTKTLYLLNNSHLNTFWLCFSFNLSASHLTVPKRFLALLQNCWILLNCKDFCCLSASDLAGWCFSLSKMCLKYNTEVTSQNTIFLC